MRACPNKGATSQGFVQSATCTMEKDSLVAFRNSQFKRDGVRGAIVQDAQHHDFALHCRQGIDRSAHVAECVLFAQDGLS